MLERWAADLSLDLGSVVQLTHAHGDDLAPWTYLVVAIDFIGDRCQLVRLDDEPEMTRRSRAGSVSDERLYDLLDDLSSKKAGIHWRIL